MRAVHIPLSPSDTGYVLDVCPICHHRGVMWDPENLAPHPESLNLLRVHVRCVDCNAEWTADLTVAGYTITALPDDQ